MIPVDQKSVMRWRKHRALLLRSRGWLLDAIADSLGTCKERARQIIFLAAYALLPPPVRHRLNQREALARALWLLRMQTFNRAMARRAYERARLTPRATLAPMPKRSDRARQ